MISGDLHPIFWSPEGDYLYFTILLGFSGGGDYCFPKSEDRSGNGLFRLNLKTGLWSTHVPFTDSFLGYAIEFSPTGRHYAVTIDGVMITDLQTGIITKIETNGVMEAFSWSPDGKNLAYTVARCDEQSVISSSAYVWDAQTNHTQVLFTIDEIVLRSESWIDNSTIRLIGEEIIDLNSFYTIYEYNVIDESLVFTGTATPSP